MTVELKLVAGNATEQRVLDYLLQNASQALAEKINAGKKTLKGAMSYCQDEARKINGCGNCVAVEDATVFGWVIHYFEEANPDEEETPEEAEKPVQEAGGEKVKGKAKKTARRPRVAKQPDAPDADPETPAEAPQPAQEAATPEKPADPPKPIAQLDLFGENGGKG